MTTELTKSAKILVSEISANKLEILLSRMARNTGGKMQFKNQLVKWLSENPDQFAKAMDLRLS